MIPRYIGISGVRPRVSPPVLCVPRRRFLYLLACLGPASMRPLSILVCLVRSLAPLGFSGFPSSCTISNRLRCRTRKHLQKALQCHYCVIISYFSLLHFSDEILRQADINPITHRDRSWTGLQYYATYRWLGCFILYMLDRTCWNLEVLRSVCVCTTKVPQ